MFYLRGYDECETLVTNYVLLRGNAKKLRLQIQLMLAVAGAQSQVAESPIIAEVKRRLATTWARKAQESGYYCMRAQEVVILNSMLRDAVMWDEIQVNISY
jgi:hypothetical protein